MDIETLIGRYRHYIKPLCIRSSRGDKKECAELLEACYYTLWRRLGALNPDFDERQTENWVVWQCRSAISHWRRNRHTDMVSLEELPDDTLTAPSDFAYNELYEHLAAQLSPRDRLVLALVVEGYTNAEIAEQLNLTPSNAKVIRHRVIARLREIHKNSNY